MSVASARQPVIIGVGQTVLRDLPAAAGDCPSAIDLGTGACRRAFADTGREAAVAAAVDCISVIRLISDSILVRPSPFGRCTNLPRAIGTALGLSPARAIYSEMGGQVPQQMLGEACNDIARGDHDLVLLAGAEVIGVQKHAVRNGWELDWTKAVEGQLDDRGVGVEVSSPYELANGMGFPPQVYGAFENAWRAAHRLTRDEHRQRMAEILAPFSVVASSHDYAQFPDIKSAEFLGVPSTDNYDVADPYLKWHVAQDAVNQGAAVIVASVEKAEVLGIDAERWVYPLASADAEDCHVLNRPSLLRSDAIHQALAQCLERYPIAADEIQHLDLYSCFPCAVQFACDALGIDPVGRPLTVTGGLPFFGGAGNNYSLHAIASMVDVLRANPGDVGLVLANGGIFTKDSVGLYSTRPNPAWQPVDNAALQAELHARQLVEVVEPGREGGTVESFSVVFQRNEPFIGYVICRTASGARFMARSDAHDLDTLRPLIDDDPIGRTIVPEVTEKRNVLKLS